MSLCGHSWNPGRVEEPVWAGAWEPRAGSPETEVIEWKSCSTAHVWW